jgi:hypothetical protein
MLHATGFFAYTALTLATVARGMPAVYHPNNHPSAPVYPDVAEVSYASFKLVKSMREYFTAKSNHDSTAWLARFNLEKITYIDAVVGFSYNTSNFAPAIEEMTRQWGPDGKSYPLRILGDLDSCVVLLRNTPELFGDELWGFAAIDFENGKVVRQVDYWDGRRIPFVEHRVPDDQFPSDFGESRVTRRRNPVIKKLTKALGAAIESGNSAVAAALFAPEAVFEDLTTRTRIQGQLAIKRYLDRALPILPYGVGASVRHSVGNHQGGGYEWIGKPGALSARGINVIELNKHQLITRFTALWDASRAGDTEMLTLTGAAIEP